MAYSWENLGAKEKVAILTSISDGSPAPPPRVIELSWQDRRNIDCFFCSTAELRAGNLELSADRLEAQFDEMRGLGVNGVRLMGGGEPLFRKDAVVERRRCNLLHPPRSQERDLGKHREEFCNPSRQAAVGSEAP